MINTKWIHINLNKSPKWNNNTKWIIYISNNVFVFPFALFCIAILVLLLVVALSAFIITSSFFPLSVTCRIPSFHQRSFPFYRVIQKRQQLIAPCSFPFIIPKSSDPDHRQVKSLFRVSHFNDRLPGTDILSLYCRICLYYTTCHSYSSFALSSRLRHWIHRIYSFIFRIFIVVRLCQTSDASPPRRIRSECIFIYSLFNSYERIQSW